MCIRDRMKDKALGSSRIDCAIERLKELNPRLEIIGLAENVTESNISGLVSESDIVVDCAPLFEERYLMTAKRLPKANLLSSAPCLKWRHISPVLNRV